jgi:hypothetical protein
MPVGKCRRCHPGHPMHSQKGPVNAPGLPARHPPPVPARAVPAPASPSRYASPRPGIGRPPRHPPRLVAWEGETRSGLAGQPKPPSCISCHINWPFTILASI